jgi:hypothetical protein
LFLLILSSPVHFQKKIFFSATVKASLKISLGLEFRWVDWTSSIIELWTSVASRGTSLNTFF